MNTIQGEPEEGLIIILTKEQLEKLNSYMGCGPHMDADILVMGNEEGTGGYPKEIEAHCTARFRLYGKNEETVEKLLQLVRHNSKILHDDVQFKNEAYAYSLDDDWRNGFWEENDKGGENKIEGYIEARDGKLDKKDENLNIPFLNFLSRICLSINYRDHDIPLEHWFKPLNEPENASDLIKDHVFTQLFKKHAAGVKTALTDWRPLPRPNQNTWFEEYNLLGDDDKKYIKAFEFNASEKGTLAYDLASRRAELLGSLVAKSKARFLFMIGEVDSKKALLHRFFPKHDVKFTPLPTRNRAYTVTLTFPLEGNIEKLVHIYILPFFGEGAISLDELCQFVRHVMLPDYLEIPRLKWVASKPKERERKKRKISTQKELTKRDLASTNTDAHMKRLESVALRVREYAPELMRYRKVKNGRPFYYLHFWYNDRLWNKDHFAAQIHDRKGDGKLEVRVGIYYGKYQGQDARILMSLVERILQNPFAAQYQPEQKDERLILKKRLEPTDQPEDVLAAAELLTLLHWVKQLYGESEHQANTSKP